MIPVLIMAAGTSSRMRGVDKLMLDVDGAPLLRRQIEFAHGIGPIFVALPRGDHPRVAALQGTDATALIVSDAAEGLGGTLRNAVAQLPGSGAFMIVLGDLISLKNNDLRAVLDAMSAFPDNLIWRGATPNGKSGHPIIFDGSLRCEFEKLQGDDGAKSITIRFVAQTYLHSFSDNRACYDLDTPEEWSAWRASNL